MNRIFLYSHGFATHADDNGLFNDVASAFPEAQHVMFEYDKWDDDTAAAATFTERVRILQDKYAGLRAENPEAEIDLICHSQGCNVAMLAKLAGVKKTLLLAPPMVYGSPNEEYDYQKNKNCSLLDDGTIVRNRSFGDKTIIRPGYFDDFALLKDPQGLCNQLSETTELFIIDALKDKVVKKDYSRLSQAVDLRHINTNHNMKDAGGGRSDLIKVLREIL